MHLQVAVRIANCLFDIRPLAVDARGGMQALEQAIRQRFADVYSDLDQYRLYCYADQELVTGVFNVLIERPSDLYSGALVTVVPRALEPSPLPRANYEDRVAHMTQARSRVLEWMASRAQYDAGARFRDGMATRRDGSPKPLA